MTSEYERHGPFAFRVGSQEPIGLHVAHSICRATDFLSCVDARKAALDLAVNLGVTDESKIDAFSLPLRQRSRRKQVKFCEDVHVSLCTEDGQEFQPITLRHADLSVWVAKPWAHEADCPLWRTSWTFVSSYH